VLLNSVDHGMGRLTASGLVLDHDEVGVRAERDEDQLSVPAYPRLPPGGRDEGVFV
jgi:hypothetical protein